MAFGVDIFENRELRPENWLCACTKPGREAFTAANCELSDYEAYFPITEVKRAGELRRTPLFSGYLFVKALADAAKLHVIEGIDSIICRDSKPVPVQAAVIAALKAREHNGIIPTEHAPRHIFGLLPGTPVRLTEGAQQGLLGIVERLLGRYRVEVAVKGAGRGTICVSVPITGLAVRDDVYSSVHAM